MLFHSYSEINENSIYFLMDEPVQDFNCKQKYAYNNSDSYCFLAIAVLKVLVPITYRWDVLGSYFLMSFLVFLMYIAPSYSGNGEE